jgi:hypothetical protein
VTEFTLIAKSTSILRAKSMTINLTPCFGAMLEIDFGKSNDCAQKKVQSKRVSLCAGAVNSDRLEFNTHLERESGVELRDRSCFMQQKVVNEIEWVAKSTEKFGNVKES